MAYKHHRRIFVVASNRQLSGVLAGVSVKYEAAVHQFSGGAECLQRLADTPCDVLIVDCDEAGAGASDLIVQARRIWPWQTCIVLVRKGAVEAAVDVMRAGATDCLETSGDPKSFLLAVEQGLRHAAVLFPSGKCLTQMELAVLNLILQGKTSREIAEWLNRSKRTIDVHRRNVFRKLGFNSSLEMIKWAVSTGYWREEWRKPPVGRRRREPIEDSTVPGP